MKGTVPNEVMFSDPFGLDSVYASGDALQAYNRGKALMSACAAGNGCSSAQSQSAAAGLRTLDAAESDPFNHIMLVSGSLSGTTPATGSFTAGLGWVMIDPNNSSITGSGGVDPNHFAPALAVHEVHEGYERLLAGVSTPMAVGQSYSYVHGRAVTQAEDPVLAAAGLSTRSSRVRNGSIENPPCSFRQGGPCK